MLNSISTTMLMAINVDFYRNKRFVKVEVNHSICIRLFGRMDGEDDDSAYVWACFCIIAMEIILAVSF